MYTYITLLPVLWRTSANAHTYPSEMIQVLECWSEALLLIINTTFDDEFFSFCKQTAATEPTLCHGVRYKVHFPIVSISLTP